MMNAIWTSFPLQVRNIPDVEVTDVVAANPPTPPPPPTHTHPNVPAEDGR